MSIKEYNSTKEQNRLTPLTLTEVFEVILHKFKFVALFSIGCAMCSALIIVIIPNKYTARSTILPTVNNLQSGGMLSLPDGIPGMEMMGINLGQNSPSILYPEILASRMLAEKVLRTDYKYSRADKSVNHSLYEYFETDNPDIAYESLRKITSVAHDKKTGIVTVSVTTKDPQLSALAANSFINNLDDFNKHQRQSGAGLNRAFIEKRIDETSHELRLAEENLKQFRENNLNYYSSTDPELLMMHDRLLREVEVKNQVYLTLTQQYEIESIQAKKELPIIQVLDEAKPPSRKSGPARAKTTLLGLLAGIVISCLTVILDFQMRHDNRYKNIKLIMKKPPLWRKKSAREKVEHVR
ncbi:MAG: hypothetical protein GY839_13275 [candidate division Zixibacteria bacterium]|nr:hypothetical protein [candidate division Zixibacteria bacterium]